MKRYIPGSGSASMGVSTIVGTVKKNYTVYILVYFKARK